MDRTVIRIGRTPGPRTPPPRRGRVPEHLAPVLAQLLTGVPDITASRKLNMSPRTFSRRVAELLEYIGVESRFQAGVEAVRRGWIPNVFENGRRPVSAGNEYPFARAE